MVALPSQSELWATGEQICRQFELGEIRQLKALSHQGYSNFNARLETDLGAYVLRRYNEQPEEKITQELRLIDWLKAQGLPVVPPLRRADREAPILRQEPAVSSRFAQEPILRQDPAPSR